MYFYYICKVEHRWTFAFFSLTNYVCYYADEIGHKRVIKGHCHIKGYCLTSSSMAGVTGSALVVYLVEQYMSPEKPQHALISRMRKDPENLNICKFAYLY